MTAIPRRFRVAVTGTWNWLEVAGELFRRAGIDSEIVPLRSRSECLRWLVRGRRFDAVHHVWGNRRFPGVVFRLSGVPTVWHWIGSDVTAFRRVCRAGGGLRGAVDRRIALRWSRAHLADSPELAHELAECGVAAQVVRLLPKSIEAPVEPLPRRPSVLSYWNPGSRDLYRCPIVLRLAAALPTVDFLIAGDEGTGLSATPNVKFLGRLRDLGEVYSRTSIYLRLVKHDSLSAMVLEAMARGRHVIYSQPFPHAELALDFDQARAALTRLLERSTANETGAAYIRANFNLDIEAQTLRSCYRQWFGPGACRAVAQDHEVRG